MNTEVSEPCARSQKSCGGSKERAYTESAFIFQKLQVPGTLSLAPAIPKLHVNRDATCGDRGFMCKCLEGWHEGCGEGWWRDTSVVGVGKSRECQFARQERSVR